MRCWLERVEFVEGFRDRVADFELFENGVRVGGEGGRDEEERGEGEEEDAAEEEEEAPGRDGLAAGDQASVEASGAHSQGL